MDGNGWKIDVYLPFGKTPLFQGRLHFLANWSFRKIDFLLGNPHFQGKNSSRFEAAEKCLGRAVEEDALAEGSTSTSAASNALLRLAQLMLQVLALRFRKPSVTWVAAYVGSWLKESQKSQQTN